jgi:ketosteroid isomerase-like protein
MSGEVLREQIALKGRSRRGLEERLALRFPRVTALIARTTWRLPRRSSLRRALVRRVVVLGWEAMNRADLEFGLALYDEDVESVFDPRAVTLGLANTRGREARRRTLSQVYGEMGQMLFDPDELIDLGDDRLLVIGRMKGRGRASGAPFEMEWANLWTISEGLVVRDEQFGDHAEAVEAAGLSADSSSRPAS